MPERISQLPAASAAAGSEVVPVVQAGATVGMTVDQVAARATATGAANTTLGNVTVPTLALITSGVRPEQFGAVGDGGADDTAALQAMSDYIATQAAAGVVLSAVLTRRYLVSGSVYIRSPQRWYGSSGHGPLAGGEGVMVITNSATADIFSVQTGGACTFDGIGFDHTVARTAGADILLDGNLSIGGTDESNTNSHIIRCVSQGPWDFLRVRAGIQWTMRECAVYNFQNCGANLSGEGGSQTTGDDSTGTSQIVNCCIWDVANLSGTASGALGACVLYGCGGDVRVDGCKLLCGVYGVLLNLNRGPRSGPIGTGTLTISNNSIEQQRIGCIRAQQAQAGNEFSNLTVVGNELSILGSIPTIQFIISVVTGTPNINPTWISLISVTGNVMNGLSGPSQARSMMDFQDGEFIYVGGNSLRSFGNTNVAGFSWGGNVRNLVIGANPSDFPPGSKYALQDDGVQALINDPEPMPTSALPLCKDGSTAFVSDGVVGDSSGNIVGGGAVGLMAIHQGGGWKAMQVAEAIRQVQFTDGDDKTVVGSIGTVITDGSASTNDLQYRVDGGDHIFTHNGYEAARFVRDASGNGAGISPVVLSTDPTLQEPSMPCLYTRSSDGALRYWNPHSAAWQTVSAA